MSELMLMKTPAGALAPADAPSLEFVAKMKTGAQLRGEFKRQRNPKFHRKVMALFNFAFDLWEAPVLEYKGQPVAKNFDRFRRDLTILAGHYTSVITLRGDVRLEAKSLSFASMGEDEFEEVFNGILGVTWDRVLKSKGYESPERVEMLLEELMRFES